jgi:[methyl coenzyme M reductase]-L-arginine C-5-methyltransferase
LIPGRVMAHDVEIRKILNRDGRDRLVFRGPDSLTVDGEMSIAMDVRQVLDIEIEAFRDLIEDINAIGI